MLARQQNGGLSHSNGLNVDDIISGPRKRMKVKNGNHMVHSTQDSQVSTTNPMQTPEKRVKKTSQEFSSEEKV